MSVVILCRKNALGDVAKLVCAAAARLWYTAVNLMGLLGKSPCKTGCMILSYKMRSLLVGKRMEEVLSVSKTSAQTGFFITWSAQVLPSCIFTLRYQFGKQSNLTFGN